jgi:alpha-tubulin suppressor-like RCC1 family protein
VIGVSAGSHHTAAWTEAGELFTFGSGYHGQLGHGGKERELVPRLVEAPGGKKVVGAGAANEHSAVWTDTGELFTFGSGYLGRLGHGGEENELVPRLVEAFAGKKVIGAAGGSHHTAVLTEAGELFTFGHGG